MTRFRPPTPTPLGVWIHVSAVIRGALDMDVYLNGVDDGGSYAGTGGPMVHGAGPTTIGVKDLFFRSGSGYFQGAIDDSYFHNRALSADEVMRLYLTGVTLDAGSGLPVARGPQL